MSGKKNSRSRSAARRKTSRPGDRQRIKLLLAALFVVGFLILCLVVLGHLRQTYHSVPPPPIVPEVVESPDRSSLILDIQLELDSTLWRAGVPFDRLRIVADAEKVSYEVRAGMPAEKVLTELAERLIALSPDARLDLSTPQKTMTIRHGGEVLFRIRFLEDEKKVLPPAPKPKLAIIVDDLGADLGTAKALLKIDLPLTFAVMPHVGKSREVAQLAHSRKREVMLHIPMEPQSYPAADPGRGALFNRLSRRELEERMAGYLKEIPHVVGGNNHMGSSFTENQDGMAVVFESLGKRKLFFIDSRTTPRSVAPGVARQAGIPFAARDVFLDNVRDVEAISREIRKLAGLARRNGQAIGICHPYPQTIEALSREAETLRMQGIEVVPASSLVRPPSS
ncbi:MAG: divergent polysaccharide deacetylase family protein [Syntrophotaleaceae bacterium]